MVWVVDRVGICSGVERRVLSLYVSSSSPSPPPPNSNEAERRFVENWPLLPEVAADISDDSSLDPDEGWVDEFPLGGGIQELDEDEEPPAGAQNTNE